MTPLDPQNKSGHYVGHDGGKCWCGDAHHYETPLCPCGNKGACASILCAPRVVC